VSSSYPSSGQRPTLATLLRSFADDPDLPFHDVLPEDRLLQLCHEEGIEFATGPDDVWDGPTTTWAWLVQCLSAGKSCVAAVTRVLVLRVALGLPACSVNTGAYCKARPKLPERFLQRLTLEVGQEVEDAAADDWRWKGKRAVLVDGTDCSMSDTPESQEVYPQPSSQKKGLGFPMIRLVVLLTLATAGLVGCAMGPRQGKETGETALFRSLLDRIRAGDVAVADRYHCSYWQVALLLARGADACFRLHQRRHYDFRKGQRLGRGDHVVTWARPDRPAWMDEETYATIPTTLSVREVRVMVSNPGYRSKEIIVATTLLDAEVYSKADIADLYHKRWHVELDIRAIKQTLKMDILSCKTPEMVRKEVWVHLLAYNLARKALAQAAWRGEVKPRQLSFAGAVQTLNAFRWLLMLAEPGRYQSMVQVALLAVGTHMVGNREGRCEPRKVKRRPKAFPLLTRTRAAERAELLQGVGA
jgi:IS4 transposase